MDKIITTLDTFIVQSEADNQKQSRVASEPTRTITLPNGERVHTLDRSVFDRAVRAAMQDKK